MIISAERSAGLLSHAQLVVEPRHPRQGLDVKERDHAGSFDL
jgi:hypothetical protein